LNYIIKGG